MKFLGLKPKIIVFQVISIISCPRNAILNLGNILCYYLFHYIAVRFSLQ
jgi:hypothetical protein